MLITCMCYDVPLFIDYNMEHTSVTFHGIYIWFPAGITLLFLVSVMHLWATLGCGVFNCHGNLVWPVRGSLGAPSMNSVAHRSLCA